MDKLESVALKVIDKKQSLGAEQDPSILTCNMNPKSVFDILLYGVDKKGTRVSEINYKKIHL